MRDLEPDALRVHISRRDFEHVARCVEGAKRYDVASIEYEALLHSAIVFYARPFLVSAARKRPRKGSRLTGFDVKGILGADVALHGRLIKLRRMVIAHAEAEHFPAHYVDLDIGDSSNLGVATSSRRWHVANEALDLEQFHRVAKAMSRACLNRTFDLAREQGRLQRGPHSTP